MQAVTDNQSHQNKNCTTLFVSVNARYSHCGYAVRTLQANLSSACGPFETVETDLTISPVQLADQIIQHNPAIVCFSVYLWNSQIVCDTATILRQIAPHVTLFAGGPEITRDYARHALFDMLMIGEGESALNACCEAVLRGEKIAHWIETGPADPDTLTLPYALYTDDDLQQRTVYVEASRGCPYGCTYCTSARTGLRLIPLEKLLPAFETLWERGLRKFKFLDRSFNAPSKHALGILRFFRERIDAETTLHFEINPDHLDPIVFENLQAFPKGALHLEAGVQTLNPQVARAIGRSPDTEKTLESLRKLIQETGATVHADLIFGLPGESWESFQAGFNRMIKVCNPQEVQVNRLKGLPGTQMVRDAKQLGLVFSETPPYPLLLSDKMDFQTIQRIERFARIWELIHNRGRFPYTLDLLAKNMRNDDYYTVYQELADRIESAQGRLYAISFSTLAEYLRAYLLECVGVEPSEVEDAIRADKNKKPFRPPLPADVFAGRRRGGDR